MILDTCALLWLASGDKNLSPPQEWFEKVVAHHGLAVLPLALNDCLTAAQLPPHHLDPCDRFIIAAAKLQRLTVVTADQQFEKYGVTVIC